MITIKISFLLALNFKADTPIKEEVKKKKRGLKSGRKSKKSSTKTSKKSKSTKKSKSKSPKTPIIRQHPDYLILELNEHPTTVHIEYNLLPNKFNYNAEITCWGPVAKISTKNGVKCVKTATVNGIVFVPIFFEHFVHSVTTEEIKKLLQEKILIHVKEIQKKGPEHVIFYLHRDKEKQMFAEVFMDIPESEKLFEIDRFLEDVLNFPLINNTTTCLYNEDDAHTCKMLDIVKNLEQHVDTDCKVLTALEKATKDKKKKKKKTKKKSKTKPMAGFKYQIPFHVLLADPALSDFVVKKDGKIQEVYTFLGSKNLMTLDQKKELCPLIVKIHKISNLPNDTIQGKGCRYIYTNCIIPGIGEFKTPPEPLKNTLRIKESKVFLTNDVPKIALLEVLETRPVIVKILGMKELPEPPPLKSTKNKKKKKKKKKKKHKKKPDEVKEEEITLAEASFDLSPLKKTYFLFKEKGQCICRNSLTDTCPAMDQHFLNNLTMNELQLCEFPKDDSLLQNSDLLSNGTNLKFEARFLLPVHPEFYLEKDTPLFQRLFLIFFDRELAFEILQSVISYNNRNSGVGDFALPVMSFSGMNLGDTLSEKILSGFFIDDGNSFLFYVEGSSNSYFLKLQQEVAAYSFATAKVFYNSEYFFKGRLFPNFERCTEIMVATVKLPLETIFAQSKLYLRGNVPLHCFRALQKLNLILNSTTFKMMLGDDLIPTELEFTSFNMEFGLQYRFKNFEERAFGQSNLDLNNLHTDFTT